MNKQKGFLLIELLASIIILSIISLAYIKMQANFLNINKKEYVQNEIDTNIAEWTQELFDRANNSLNYNFSSLEYYINNFQYSDCNNQNANIDEQEFNDHICHIAKIDRNAKFLIKPCNSQNLLCINYYSNQYNYKENEKCSNNVNCYSQPLWGVYLSNNILKPLIIKP